MSTDRKIFTLQIRVYLEDTDAQGVVYNASYFRFLERARTDFLRDAGLDHATFEKTYGAQFVLAGIYTRFKAPSRLSDILSVTAAITDIRGARITFEQQILRRTEGEALVCEAVAEVALVRAANRRPMRVPEHLIQELMA